jgi:SAM-dependent methyltransferase
MPNVANEKREYDESYQWPEGGHEWSSAWGSADDQWVGTIHRRIFRLLPTRSILEIAPGFGRWTPYLINHCSRYYGIDIAARCVTHCRRAYGALHGRPAFLLGDGLSLAGIADSAISLVFSFDSLVHVDLACLTSYAAEIHRVLEPGGHALIHHSNLAEYVQNGVLNTVNFHRRDATVSAELAADAFRRTGLISLVHEKIQWIPVTADQPFADCLSLVRKPRPGGKAAETDPAAIFYNHSFFDEIAQSRQLYEHYRVIDES